MVRSAGIHILPVAKSVHWPDVPVTYQNKNVKVGPANLLNFNDGMSFDAFCA